MLLQYPVQLFLDIYSNLLQNKITTPLPRGHYGGNTMPNTKVQEEVLNRLRNVKGHVAGIERMVGDNAQCKDVLLQLLAIRSSIEKIGIFILENNAADCLMSENIPPEEKEKVNQLIKNIVAFLK